MPIEWIIPLAIALLVIFTIYRGLCIVQQSQTVIIERLGKYYRTLSSGVNIIIPYIDRPRPMRWRYTLPGPNGQTYVRFTEITHIDLRETVYDFPRQSVITKDNVTMRIDSVVFFVITDPKLYAYGVDNPIAAIENLTATTLRNIIGSMDLDTTLTSRDEINTQMRSLLDVATDPWGIKVNRVELKNILPPDAIREAMEKQMKAEREKREAITLAEAKKQSAVLTAEGNKQAAILNAEADKQKTILAAEAQKEKEIREAEGRAQAIRSVKEAEAEGIRLIRQAGADDAVLKLRSLEAFASVANGRATKIIIPSDLQNMGGLLAGLKETLDTPIPEKND